MGPYIGKHFHLTLLHSMVMERGVDAEIEGSMLRGVFIGIGFPMCPHILTTPSLHSTHSPHGADPPSHRQGDCTHELLITQTNPFLTALMCIDNVSLAHIPPRVTWPCRDLTREIACREPWCCFIESNEQTLETSVITAASAVSNCSFAVTHHCGMCQMREENEVSHLHWHP